MAEQKSAQSAQDLPQPLRAAASVLSKVPGAGMVGRAAEGALDKVGAVSPRGRRIAVYTGAGVLGVAGVVEWPVAITGAAVAWLTQPRQAESEAKAEEKAEVEEAGAGGGSEGAGGAGSSGGEVPTPRVLASTSPPAVPTSTPATPSDKLPPHHSGNSDKSGNAGSTGSTGRTAPAGSTTRRDRTSG